MNSETNNSNAMQELKSAFDEMMEKLNAAREAIDDPALKPPEPTDRHLAEGYRYLMGYMYSAVERAMAEDTDFPYFRRAIPVHNKSTWDNADNLYLSAAIDGNASYRITGKAKDTRHWRGESAVESERAPLYIIFTAVTQYTGDSGSIAELTPEVTNNAGSLDNKDLAVDKDGSFEILLAPEKPKGYTGNYLCTTTVSPEGTPQTCNYIICRQLFGDWVNEETVALHIVNTGNIGAPKAVASPEDMAKKMRRMGDIVNNQMRFWNDFYATILDGYGDSPVKTPFAFPGPNQPIQPSPPSATVGAAQKTNIYSGGTFDLESDEALIIEQTIPIEPIYTGFNLNNIWGESFDYTNYITSINNLQASTDSDGKVRYVISEQDPGINNWLDTTGLNIGMLSQRWAYYDEPAELPTLKVTKVKFDQLEQCLPADTLRVTSEQRREQIIMRQDHTQRRFKQA